MSEKKEYTYRFSIFVQDNGKIVNKDFGIGKGLLIEEEHTFLITEEEKNSLQFNKHLIDIEEEFVKKHIFSKIEEIS